MRVKRAVRKGATARRLFSGLILVPLLFSCGEPSAPEPAPPSAPPGQAEEPSVSPGETAAPGAPSPQKAERMPSAAPRTSPPPARARPSGADPLDAMDEIESIPYDESDPATAVAKLRPWLDNPDMDLRETALMALAAVEGGEANRALADHARREPDAMLKSDVLDELVDRRAPETLDTLLYLLGDPDPEVRERAADGLDELGDPRATPSLYKALQGESDEFVRDAIVFALESLDPAFDEELLEE